MRRKKLFIQHEKIHLQSSDFHCYFDATLFAASICIKNYSDCNVNNDVIINSKCDAGMLHK